MIMRSILVAAAGLLAGSPAVLHAATFTQYTDRAAFTTAAGNVAIDTFNSYATPTRIGGGLDGGAYSIVETQFGQYGGGSEIQSPTRGSVNGTNFLSANLYNGGSAYGSYLTFTFDTPITAFGGNWFSGSVNRIFLDVLGAMVDGRAPDGGGFFGFVSDTPFTTIVLRSRNGNFQAGLDNLTYSISSAAPEPASWAMMVGGFGLIGTALRSRRKAKPSFA